MLALFCMSSGMGFQTESKVFDELPAVEETFIDEWIISMKVSMALKVRFVLQI